MTITSVLAVIPVADFDSACGWYERFFGRPADRIPMEGLAEWHLTGTSWVQVFHDTGRAGRTAVNFFVDNLDETIKDLATKGIVTSEPQVVAQGRQRLATATDPDGNQVTAIEALS